MNNAHGQYSKDFLHTLFGKEVGFEVGSDSKVGFLFPTYIFLLINHYMSVYDVGIRRAVRAKLDM